MKKYNKAKDSIANALEIGGGNNPVTLEHYGDVLFQLNEVESAIEYWTKAQEKGSKSKLLEKKIADRQLYE